MMLYNIKEHQLNNTPATAAVFHVNINPKCHMVGKKVSNLNHGML